jgi:hypothetical protein
MSLADLVKGSAGTRMVDEDGNEDVLRLLPPATAEQIRALEADLPCPVPSRIRALLSATRGFENGPLESMDFCGLPGGFGMEELFPHALALAHDGFGNYWIADLHPDSVDWAPANPPHESELDTVHEEVVTDIWRHDPGVISATDGRASDDASVRALAESLDDHWEIFDLRNATVGDGFSWGRYGPQTRVVRAAAAALFAREPRSRLQRLFGR